jgi:hypothetical protein
MIPKKICIGCEVAFTPKRSNQLYHNATCRNKYNMIAFRNREADLYKRLKKIQIVDHQLSLLYTENEPDVFIVDKSDFAKIGILNSRSSFVKITDNELEEIRFFNFKLIRIQKDKYEITRNKFDTTRKF